MIYSNVKENETFIIRMIVLQQIIAIMKYSNGVEVTRRQIRYFIEFLSSGMNNDRGRAFNAKSIHCFLKIFNHNKNLFKLNLRRFRRKVRLVIDWN